MYPYPNEKTKQVLAWLATLGFVVLVAAGLWRFMASLIDFNEKVSGEMKQELNEPKAGAAVKVKKEPSAELLAKIDSFKSAMINKKLSDDLSAEKIQAMDLYNQISLETGRPPALNLKDYSFEEALLNSIK